MFKYLGNWSRIKISNNKFKIGYQKRKERLCQWLQLKKSHMTLHSALTYEFVQCI